MFDWKNSHYSKIDIPEVNISLFYPRNDENIITANPNIEQVMIPVGNGFVVSSIWTAMEDASATVLFFHGNGELASEYVDIAGLFRRMNIRFICADYRGYGRSSGIPGVSSMFEDAHDIFKYVSSRIDKKKELFVIMGRSLGCASALEVAAAYGNQIDGLIIESGFAETLTLLRTLGVDTDYLEIKEEDGFANQEKIKNFTGPLLIIHAEDDFLIPVTQAEKLFAAAKAPQKKFLRIANAGHNDIFFTGMNHYLAAINELIIAAAKYRKAD